jgi:hypothetical protein
MLTYYYNCNAKDGESKVVDRSWVSTHSGYDPEVYTAEEMAALGFYKYNPSPVPLFNRDIYCLKDGVIIDSLEVNQVLTVEALPLGQSKSTFTQRVNSQAHTLLSPTDWMVVRQAESGIAIPAEISAWREAVRAEAQLKKESIGDCKTAKRLEAYVSSEDYSTWPTLPTPN